MKKSKFSKLLHKRNDGPAREAVMTWFERHGMPLQIHADDKTIFDGDLIEPKTGVIVECERKVAWREKKWPYDSVHGVARKKKLFQSGECMLAIVSNDCKRICLIQPKVLQKYCQDWRFEKVCNVRVKSGENFYNIPVFECLFDEVQIKIEDNFFTN